MNHSTCSNFSQFELGNCYSLNAVFFVMKIEIIMNEKSPEHNRHSCFLRRT
jgi:hypothetical protein